MLHGWKYSTMNEADQEADSMRVASARNMAAWDGDAIWCRARETRLGEQSAGMAPYELTYIYMLSMRRSNTRRKYVHG